MPDEPRPVDVHEMVYGSAARLLEPGATDLGVIASTRDFPADVARRLASHRGGIAADRGGAGAVRYIVGMLGSRLEFTRIQMGTDHTGRTIPFVRHLLLPVEGANRWGDLVRRAAAHAQDPRQAIAGWISPAPRLGPSRPAPPPDEGLAKAIAAAAETVMRYPETKRPVLLVHAPPASADPAADPFLGIVAAIGDVLPRGALPALVVATNVLDPGDRLPEASVLATHPGTPFHAEMTGRAGSRRPLVIDVARAAVEGGAQPPSTFVKATVADLLAGRPGRFADLCDRLRAKPDHWPLVAEVHRARLGVDAQPGLASADAFYAAVRKAGGGAAGAALDRGMLQSLFVETIDAGLGGIAKDAAAQADGAGRLGTLLAVDEALQRRAAEAGIAALRAGTRPVAEALARALADVGADAIAVARQVAGTHADGRFFLLLVEPPAPTTSRGAGPKPVEPAARKEKPQRRDSTAGPRVLTGGTMGGGHGNQAAGGASWWWRLLTVALFAPALAGVVAPIWQAYEPPPETGPAMPVADPPPGQPKDRAEQPPPRPRAWDAAHREALGVAIDRAKPRLFVPGILCLVALVLLLFNGALTRLACAALRPVGGAFLAAFLPALALLAVSAAGLYLGYPEVFATGRPEAPAADSSSGASGRDDGGETRASSAGDDGPRAGRAGSETQ